MFLWFECGEGSNKQPLCEGRGQASINNWWFGAIFQLWTFSISLIHANHPIPWKSDVLLWFIGIGKVCLKSCGFLCFCFLLLLILNFVLVQQNYTILNESDIRQRQEDDIARISSVLSISRVASIVLLRHFNWYCFNCLSFVHLVQNIHSLLFLCNCLGFLIRSKLFVEKNPCFLEGLHCRFL